MGIESTIVDLTSARPALLRPGHISVSQLEATLGMPVLRPTAASPRVSGSLAAHYAPAKPLQLVSAGRMTEAIAAQREAGVRGVIAVYAFDAPQRDAGILWRAAPPGSTAYAHDLYAVLREFDNAVCERILVESPPRRQNGSVCSTGSGARPSARAMSRWIRPEDARIDCVQLTSGGRTPQAREHLRSRRVGPLTDESRQLKVSCPIT